MYERSSDEELIELVRTFQKNNSPHILENLCVKCEGMIKFVLKKYYPMTKTYNIDEEDLRQDLYLKFVKSVHLFPKNYDSFEKYIFNCLRNHALNFFKYNSNRLDVHDYTKGEMSFVSMYVETNEGSELLEMFHDENSLSEFDKVIDDIDNNLAKSNIRNILNNMVSDSDIDLLYDMYGVNGYDYTMKELCSKYNITLNELICWERLIIMTIQTNKQLNGYFEQLMSNVSLSYNYTYSRFKCTFTSSTEHIAIKNVYLEQKINDLLLNKSSQNRKMVTLHNLISKCNPDNEMIFGEKIAKEYDIKFVT